ncbi:hypothetical protein F0U44_17700 [Nocardioides humilatus]|uniref:Uncharacterized protein n=1 Tax=Nocardioides humilatus TaxID=2607660 RepID=A0A5B1L9Q6_9ACTN|nr:hypothetical protein [Nocardioides humilatus]KAA1417014.1 hypothetical protein F0U44_17700 [Nocardioides humilatus]
MSRALSCPTLAGVIASAFALSTALPIASTAVASPVAKTSVSRAVSGHGSRVARGETPCSAGQGYAVKAWIIAYGPGGTDGHAFMMLRNIGETQRHFHSITLMAGQALTFGTWGNREDGQGIYLNLEGHFFHKSGAYGNNVALSKNMCLGDFQWLRDNLEYYNEWSTTRNCSTFAAAIWNQLIAPGRVVDPDDGVWDGVDTPTRLAHSIDNYDELVDVDNLPNPPDSKVKRFRDPGNVDQVSPSSLEGSGGSSG